MEGLRHCATKIMEIENQRLWHDLIPFFCYKCKKTLRLKKIFFSTFFSISLILYKKYYIGGFSEGVGKILLSPCYYVF